MFLSLPLPPCPLLSVPPSFPLKIKFKNKTTQKNKWVSVIQNMYWSRVLKLNVLRVTLFIEFCEMFWTQGRGPSLRLGTLRCCAVDILKLRCECGFMSVY